MAQIVPSKLHPSEEVKYSLSGGEFSLAPDGSYTTDDPVLILNAYSHPWLDVVQDPPTGIVFESKSPHMDPMKDVLAAAHDSDAFDVEKLIALEASKVRQFPAPVAIEAGLDQEKKIIEHGVAETVAAEPVVTERAERATEKAVAAVEKKKGDN